MSVIQTIFSIKSLALICTLGLLASVVLWNYFGWQVGLFVSVIPLIAFVLLLWNALLKLKDSIEDPFRSRGQ